MNRKIMIRNQEIVTVAVPREVQRAISDAQATPELRAVLDAALEPFGLTVFDIAEPEFRQVIYEDQVGQALHSASTTTFKE